ncbi:MAG: hypothetical protein NXH91_06485 [Phyllobacteriaceae bacterium]|nr:hypothetical protein [Phyllobacteriaceae bacterium]
MNSLDPKGRERNMGKEPDSLSIRFGKAFEASANGRFAITILLIAFLGFLGVKAFGLW